MCSLKPDRDRIVVGLDESSRYGSPFEVRPLVKHILSNAMQSKAKKTMDKKQELRTIHLLGNYLLWVNPWAS
ncbi:MAG: hypothetical protein OSB39_14125 [Opitutales bacterium]|nr:hypothetical protein [Opitutales bacterium]